MLDLGQGNSTIRFTLLAIFLFGSAVPALAEAPERRQIDASTGQDFPCSASVRRHLLNADLVADRKDDALRRAAELARDGFVFTAAAREICAVSVGEEAPELP
ncbi:MAG: hypothetical protein ABIT16_10775 [Croceibacterium sp.]